MRPLAIQFCPRAASVYQIPEANKTIAQAPANRIRKDDGNMNHATTAAAADNPPQR